MTQQNWVFLHWSLNLSQELDCDPAKIRLQGKICITLMVKFQSETFSFSSYDPQGVITVGEESLAQS